MSDWFRHVTLCTPYENNSIVCAVDRQFADQANAYLGSAVHAQGNDYLKVTTLTAFSISAVVLGMLVLPSRLRFARLLLMISLIKCLMWCNMPRATEI